MKVLLFSHDPAYSAAAIAGGIEAVIVDWEWSDKAARQVGRGTEINRGTTADLAAAVAVAPARTICRINNTDARAHECRTAIAHGAAEIWLPMVREVGEIEACLRAIDGRAALGALVETRAGMRLGRALRSLPLSRVYIGLHDYRIDAGGRGLFDPLVDGTLDRFRDDYDGAFGVAGITLPEGGSPVPQRLLLAAMARLRCGFGVARRSFRADVPAPAIAAALARIGQSMTALHARGAAQVASEHAQLARRLDALAAADAATESACAP